MDVFCDVDSDELKTELQERGFCVDEDQYIPGVEDFKSDEIKDELARRGYSDFTGLDNYFDDFVTFVRKGEFDKATKSLRNFVFSTTGHFLPFKITKLA